MALDIRENGGIIFKNDRKESDSHPDYTGEIDVKGTKQRIALWVKEGQKGKFFSVKISDPFDAASVSPPTGDESDDLPF